MGCSRALGIISMNISAHYFNHGSAYTRKGAWFICSCFSGPKILIIKAHAVCNEVPTFDLQVLLKNIVKKEASCAIYTCNLMLYLLRGVSLIYVCSRGCSFPLFWYYSLQQNITGPLQTKPLLSLINLLLLAHFFLLHMMFHPDKKRLLSSDHQRGMCFI